MMGRKPKKHSDRQTWAYGIGKPLNDPEAQEILKIIGWDEYIANLQSKPKKSDATSRARSTCDGNEGVKNS